LQGVPTIWPSNQQCDQGMQTTSNGSSKGLTPGTPGRRTSAKRRARKKQIAEPEQKGTSLLVSSVIAEEVAYVTRPQHPT